MRGLLWSHLLASLCGGLVVAGVLLAFGVIGKQHTETIDYSAAPPASSGGVAVNSDTAQIYNGEAPGVVFIRARIQQHVASPFLRAAEDAGDTSTGSGFLIASSGYILTSYHVVEGADPAGGITVVFDNDYSRKADLVDSNPANDIALLRVPQASMKGLPAAIRHLSLGNSRTVGVGDAVLSIANPFGTQRTLSSGIISALQTSLGGQSGASIDNVIQTDGAADPAASGGPLLDSSNGQVIGINSEMRVGTGASSYFVGFAVPIRTAEEEIIPKDVLGP